MKNGAGKIFFLVTVFIFIHFSPLCNAQVIAGKNLSIHSRILDRDVSYSVLLPSSYLQDKRTYPVIFLLHGFGGDHKSWLDRCDIARVIDSLKNRDEIIDFIYVMPDAGKSYYINNYDSSLRYQDFFINELVPAVDSLFRTRKQKEYRTLMGLSMGGYGSIILTVKYPSLFGTSVAFSPAVRNEEHFMGLPQNRYELFFGPVYGHNLMKEERITSHWQQNSPYQLINPSTANNYQNINWYIDCGLNDSLLISAIAFHKLLLQYNIGHNLHIRPGDHNWQYWRQSTIEALKYVSMINSK